MNLGKWVVGGLIGGAIGAAIWAAITYFANAEIGWIAWGIGFIVGFGVRIAAGEADGFGPGVTAAVIAVLSIVAGKYIAISLLVSNMAVSLGTEVSADDMIVRLADDICEQRVAKGQTIAWPEGMTQETATEQQHYPADIWKEANDHWTKLGPTEQQQKIAERKKELEAFQGEFAGAMRNAAFKESFGPFDALWFILAMLTAFRLGSGATSDE